MSNLSVKPFTTYGQRVANWVFNKLPSMEFKNPRVLKSIKWTAKHITSPQNRLILGATALMSQPFIDLHNRNVDDETRKVSAARTVAKILAGTTTGFLVRYYSIKAVDAFTQNPDKSSKILKSCLTPMGVKRTINGMKKYRFTIGTILSLAVMMFTNFAIDAPLTKALTNVFVKKIKEHERNKIDNTIMSPPQNVENKKETDTYDTYFHHNMNKFINNRMEAK